VTPSTWVPVEEGSPFPLHNLPYGVFTTEGQPPHVGVAIGEFVLDLAGLTADGLLDDLVPHARPPWFVQPSLNEFMAAGRSTWRSVRTRVTEILSDESYRDRVREHLVKRSQVTMQMPWEVGDYVDFYSSLHHARNMGKMFRPHAEPLTPNWRHLPIGYHGRAGTVVVSGTPVVRPCGQRKEPKDSLPSYGPTQRLDIEAEIGFVVGVPSELGTQIPVEDFRKHVFGIVLVNDWSARDLQAWEYMPLGPFAGKSFATSVSPWVVTMDALAEAEVDGPRQRPQPLHYLRGGFGFDITLEVRLNGNLVSRPPFADMYWTPAQQLAHLTVNGASVRTGDLFASGTVSGSEPDQRGSFIELSWNGADPIALPDGSERAFLADGDTVEITATAPGKGGRIGFGEVSGRVQPPGY
jgi:fumarylacetoacetase